MFDFFALLTFFVGIVPVVANSMAIADTEVVANENLSSTHKIKITELEKQEGTILSLVKYKDDLYAAIVNDKLFKIDSDGKITEVSLAEFGDSSKNITFMKEFDGNLYLVNTSEKTSVLLRMEPNGEITEVYENGDDEFIKSLEIFNDELYLSIASTQTDSNLIKFYNKNVSSVALTFPDKILPSELKTFNNHLYFVVKNVSNGNVEIKTLDSNREVKKITEMKNQVPTLHLTEFKDELYFSLYDGSLFKISTSGEVKEVVKRNLSSDSNLIVFKDELYMATGNKLEKLIEDNEIKNVVELRSYIVSLAEFNDELYVGMVDGYSVKIS